jgi:hypothetical protein
MNPYQSQYHSHHIQFPKLRQLYLQRVTSVRFSVDHIEDLLLDNLTSRITSTPVVSGTNALLSDKEILWVVNVFVGTGLNAMENLIETLQLIARKAPPDEYRTLGSKSNKIARGIYRVSSL